MSNSKQVIADLLAIESEVEDLSIRAHAIMASNKALLEGLLVRKWKRLWRIINCIEHRGVISCYGRVVPKNGRGRPPYRRRARPAERSGNR